MLLHRSWAPLALNLIVVASVHSALTPMKPRVALLTASAPPVKMIKPRKGPPILTELSPTATNEDIVKIWEFALDPEQWAGSFDAGHPTMITTSFENKHPGISSLPALMAGRINAAYAAKHGYDVYAGRFENCPDSRDASWCTRASALALLDMKDTDGKDHLYDWVVVHDEDVVFTHGDLSIEDYVASLAQPRASGTDVALDQLMKGHGGEFSYHRAVGQVCLVVGRDLDSGKTGINTGVLMLHNTAAARSLLLQAWSYPLEHASESKFLKEWPYEKYVLDIILGLNTNPELERCVHAVPSGDLFGNHERDDHLAGAFMFQNTGGLCGRPHRSPRGGMAQGKKIDCLDELYGRDLLTLFLAVPAPATTECGHSSVKVDTGMGRGFLLNLTKHCLDFQRVKDIPAVFLQDPRGSPMLPAAHERRVAKVPCLTKTCTAKDERDAATKKDRAEHNVDNHANKDVPAKLIHFRDLPSIGKDGTPLSRHAFVTLITMFSCESSRNIGYVIGAFALVESLLRTGTKLRVVVAISDWVEDADHLASYFSAVGAEPCLLEYFNHYTADSKTGLGGVARWHRKRHIMKQHHSTGDQQHHSTGEKQANEPPRRRLDLRWAGMFSKILLWEPGGAFDRIVYLDADHLVLTNIDRIIRICHESLCGVNDMSQIAKTWDMNYVNAGLLALRPNFDDFNGLLAALENNTLTHGRSEKYDGDSLMSLRDGRDTRGTNPKLAHSYFTGGKGGSLLEQDLLNAFFWNRTSFLAAGFNSWANILSTSGALEPGKFFETPAEVDRFVRSRLYVLHGPLWQKTDGYQNGVVYSRQLRQLWVAVWQGSAPRILAHAEAKGFNGQDDQGYCLVEATKKCVACSATVGTTPDRIEQCWFKCTES